MGSQPKLSTEAPTHALPKKPLIPLEKLEARIKLLHALQISQQPDQLLKNFFTHIQPLIRVTGMRFKFHDEGPDAHCGKDALHHCDYRLTTEEGYLGEIIFCRSRRFAEEELATLELLLGALVYPLRNALGYQTAIRLSLLDPLTGLGNRAALDTALYRELQLAERHQHELSLLMIDIDHFKQINDVYGHVCGDEVLKAVAKTIQEACRESDISFRFGGEEFVVLLRKTGTIGARIIAERIREQIAKLILGQTCETIRPTVSIGIGTRAAGKREHIRDLFERADKALYRAKTEGRNCTIDCILAK